MADTDFAALWRSLSPPTRSALGFLDGDRVRGCNPHSMVAAELVANGLAFLISGRYTVTLTPDGRALARWAAEHGAAISMIESARLDLADKVEEKLSEKESE